MIKINRKLLIVIDVSLINHFNRGKQSMNLGEEKQGSLPRYKLTTAIQQKNHIFGDSSSFEGYSLGYNPYATVHLRRNPKNKQQKDHNEHIQTNSHKTNISDLLKSPFQRIKRVQHIIYAQKQQQLLENGDDAKTMQNNSFRSHFKVKTSKNHQLSPKNNLQEKKDKVHLQNLSLDFGKISESPKDMGSVGFLQTFKNRQKLHRKNLQKHPQTSLLDMLNRISDGAPIQRYKSRAFGSSNKVTTFFHNSHNI